MTRTLAILKYLPGVLCGLLVLAWVGSLFVELVAQFPIGKGRGAFYLENACVAFTYRSAPTDWIIQFSDDEGWKLTAQSPSPLSRWVAVWGSWNWHMESAASVSNAKYYRLQLPVPLLIVVAIPLAAAPLTRCRFPLWSWFAWTALVAAALAYYLR